MRGVCQIRGITESARGDFAAARRWLDEGAGAARLLGAGDLIASSMVLLARVDWEEGDVEAGLARLEAALPLAEGLGSSFLSASARHFMAMIARTRGDAGALALAETSLAEFRRFGSEEGIAAAMRTVGQCEPDPRRAADIYLERLEILRRIGSQGGIATCLEDFADVLRRLGLDLDALRLLSVATGVRERIGAPVPPSDQHTLRRLETDLRTVLGESAYREAAAEWRTMTPAVAAAHVRGRLTSQQ